MKTKGRRRAVVAVAGRLAVLLHRMWADGTEKHVLKQGSPLPIRYMRAAMPPRHHPDCEENRDPEA